MPTRHVSLLLQFLDRLYRAGQDKPEGYASQLVPKKGELNRLIWHNLFCYPYMYRAPPILVVVAQSTKPYFKAHENILTLIN